VEILICIWAPAAATSSVHQEWADQIILEAQVQPATQPAEILHIITKDTLPQALAAQQVTSPDIEEQMAGPD
jgi:hypothetical protein